ncbi:M6 family metalloprotease domain-containing protein [Pseudoalteromonas sp. C2R02]|uniref:M6 family metalloprotease domain-containing protein n=1 Tax=Pseudoalteromonas sp. C2R02 TaxID=2841565 RepID=UPI001C08EFC1|nr:Calx-beta domain-containing protein [Pseudoalteromonas sp. C2R02]MBU2970745.1 M6 family metalloprotease domain-containing protein [Pseudoalteromonas sp. C2R02]
MFKLNLKALCILCALLYPSLVNALQPPTAKQLAQYKKNGTLQQKLNNAKKLANYKISPNLSHHTKNYINDKLGVKAASASIPGHRGLPSTGNVKTFTLLLDFPDAKAPDHQTVEVINNHIYGEGLPQRYPVESLTSFYKRSSYDQLNIGGNVIGWYTTPYPRTDITDARAVIKEALTYYETQGHDFSQYDNDNDGYIDYFSVVWTGEVGEWASLWWGWQSSFSDANYTLTGKQLAAFSWQWLSWNNETDDFDPLTLIHETGHGLGLPDFYDYDGNIGPVGGVGGLDMMDATWGDHGAFSKFALGWIEPKVIAASDNTISLSPSSNTKDALIIMPDLSLDKKYSEYFVVQNRDKMGNDQNMPNEGLLIWHINAATNEYGFIHDNSYSDNKLIRLMEADGHEHIEQGLGADAADYYIAGNEFGTTSTPHSENYQNQATGVEIEGISIDSPNITFNANIAQLPEISFSNISNLQTINDQQLVDIEITPIEQITKVEFYLDGTLLAEDNSAPFSAELDTTQMKTGEISLLVNAYTSENTKSHAQISMLKLPEVSTPLIIDIGQSKSISALSGALKSNSISPIIISDIPTLDVSKTPILFIDNASTLGLTEQQLANLLSYVSSGGHVYYENTEWYWEGNTINAQMKQFGIETNFAWSQNVSAISGASDSPVYGISYSVPEGSWQLYTELIASSGATGVTPIWQLDEPNLNLAVINQIGDAKFIASTTRFSDIPTDKHQLIMSNYLSYFGQTTAPKTPKVNVMTTEVSQAENSGALSVELQRDFDDGSQTSINVRLEPITAVEGVDYKLISEPIIKFSEGQLEAAVFIELINNQIADPDRQLKLIIEGENAGNTTEALITIQNEDIPGNVKFAMENISVNENESIIPINIFHYGDGITPHSLKIKVISDTAIADVDFEAFDIEYTLAGDEYTKSFDLKIINNQKVDVDRKLKLVIDSEYKTDDYQDIEITIVDDELRGKIQLAQHSAEYIEDAGVVNIQIQRIGGSDDELSFKVRTLDETAIGDSDFVKIDQEFKFLSGETSKTISIDIIDNQLIDGPKQFQLALESEYLQGSEQKMVITITDNDMRGKIQFKTATLSIAENSDSFEIEVQRVEGSVSEIPFTIKSKDNTAIAGTDFTSINESLTLSSGELSKTISLNVIDNNIVENDKYFTIIMESDYLINGFQEIVVTINNDDKTTPIKPVEPEKSSSGGSLAFLLVFIPLILRRYTK